MNGTDLEQLDDSFPGTYGPDRFVILWTAESHGTATNTSKLYLNLATETYPAIGFSGNYFDGVMCGHLDMREGLRHILANLKTIGQPLPVWVRRGWLWLLSYADEKVLPLDHKAVTAERISRLPADVRAAIAGGVE